MNKQAFNQTLRQYLSSLPEADIDKSLTYFNEMIDDRLDEGMTEEEAVADLGDVRLIADSILSEEKPLLEQLKQQFIPKKNSPGWQRLLLILTSPLWFAIIILVFTLGLTLFILYFALWIFAGATVIAGVFAILASLFRFFGNIYEGLLTAGFGFFILGFGCLVLSGLFVLRPHVKKLYINFRKRGI